MDATQARLDALRRVAEEARRFLEPLWLSHTLHDEWSRIDPPLSRGTCRVSSEFLAAVMAERGFRGWAVHGSQLGYVRDGGERWPHYWISDGIDVVDVTADQFGMPAIVVGPADRTRYAAGVADPDEKGAAHSRDKGMGWHALWRERAGIPFRSAMTAEAMDLYMGPGSAALATALGRHVDGDLARVGNRVVLVADGAVMDAAGVADLQRYAYLTGVEAEQVVPLDAFEAGHLRATVTRDALDAAWAFAACHPALHEVVRQAWYEARESWQEGTVGEADGERPGSCRP